MNMQSMTGFGQCQGRILDLVCTVEIRSVNHRFFDLKFRLPPLENTLELEQALALKIRNQLRRGSITFTLRYTDHVTAEPRVQVNPIFAKAYANAWTELYHLFHTQTQHQHHLQGPGPSPDLAWIAAQPGVFTQPTLSVSLPITPVISLTEQALQECKQHRVREGKQLQEEFLSRCVQIKHTLDAIERIRTEGLEHLFSRLQAQARTILSKEIPEERLMQELALLATHADIAEELSRMRIHLNECIHLCHQPEPIGRQFDFFLQELFREANTIGSKSSFAEITRLIILIKTELERMREQVQNVE